MELTVWLALVAGVISFISPCVLPLVPAYIGYMGGRATNLASKSISTSVGRQFDTVSHGVFFVMGFTLVFVTIGLISTAFIQQVGGANISNTTDLIGRVGGIVIVFFGLHFMGALRTLFSKLRAREDLLNNRLFSVLVVLGISVVVTWAFSGSIALWNSPLWQTSAWIPVLTLVLLAGWWLLLIAGGAFIRPALFWQRTLNLLEEYLYSDTRLQVARSSQGGYLSSGFMGIVFAAGWTPCIGPVYGAVLTMAASGGDVGKAGLLLTSYSLGLGIPFLLTALMLDNARSFLRRIQRHMRTIELASGIFLIIIGITIATGQLQRLSAQFADDFAEFSIGLEESVLEIVTGGRVESISQPSSEIQETTATIGLDLGNIAPNFQTVTEMGEVIVLEELRGQVVLVNFWATWCGPCRIEMPAFQQQFNRYADEGLVVVAVNNREGVEDVIRFRDQFGLSFILAMDEQGDIQNQYGIVNYPTTLVLDREGVIVARHFGIFTPPQIEAAVTRFFGDS